MTYKGFLSGGKVQTNTYGELTYEMDMGRNSFKEKGLFDDSFRLKSGVRDIHNGYWKMVGDI